MAPTLGGPPPPGSTGVVRKRTAQDAGLGGAPAITKRHATGSMSKSAPVVGLSMKTPGAPPPGAPPRPIKKAKSPAVFSKMPVPGAAAPGAPATGAAAAAPLTGMQTAIGELLGSVKAAQGQAKLQHITILADALVRGLQIDHLNVLLRAMKKKLHVRAQREGITPATAVGGAAGSDAAAPKAAAPVRQAAAPVNGQAITKSMASAPPAAPPSAPRAAAPPSAPLAASPTPKPAAPSKPTITKSKPSAPTPTPKQTAPAAPVRKESSFDAGGDSMTSPASPREDLEGTDPLFQTVAEIVDNPVVKDGVIRDDRLQDILRKLWMGSAKRPKDWVAVWQAMTIPVDKQAEAISVLLNMAFADITEDIAKAPTIVADLIKAHKVKMKSVEEALVAFGGNVDGLLAMNSEALQIYAVFLLHVCPKPQNAGWGWSRVGWSWQSWWQYCERCVGSLEPERGLEVLAVMLRLIQEREGSPLGEVQAWSDGNKLTKALERMTEIGACTQEEVVERLGQEGIIMPEPIE